MGFHDLIAGRFAALQGPQTQETFMANMSDNKRKKIVARQRKLRNSTKRAAKLTKKSRNRAA